MSITEPIISLRHRKQQHDFPLILERKTLSIADEYQYTKGRESPHIHIVYAKAKYFYE
jgi:hypothetical protein